MIFTVPLGAAQVEIRCSENPMRFVKCPRCGHRWFVRNSALLKCPHCLDGGSGRGGAQKGAVLQGPQNREGGRPSQAAPLFDGCKLTPNNRYISV